MTDTELLKFEITLSGTYWDKIPEFEILINNNSVYSGQITCLNSRRGLPASDPNDILAPEYLQVIAFEQELAADNHVLGIRLKNKTQDQTSGFINGVWLRDMLITVEKIKIDDIDLQNLIFTESIYEFDQPQTHNGNTANSCTNCTSLGHNGTFKLPFVTPFYMWLMEKL
jgi:hypothetical protein